MLTQPHRSFRRSTPGAPAHRCGAGQPPASWRLIERLAGEIASRRPRALVITSRTAARAATLARRCGAQAMAWGQMLSHLGEFDLVIACSGSAVPIISLGTVARALEWRDLRPMPMFNLALPRDIAPEVVHGWRRRFTMAKQRRAASWALHFGARGRLEMPGERLTQVDL